MFRAEKDISRETDSVEPCAANFPTYNQDLEAFGNLGRIGQELQAELWGNAFLIRDWLPDGCCRCLTLVGAIENERLYEIQPKHGQETARRAGLFGKVEDIKQRGLRPWRGECCLSHDGRGSATKAASLHIGGRLLVLKPLLKQQNYLMDRRNFSNRGCDRTSSSIPQRQDSRG